MTASALRPVINVDGDDRNQMAAMAADAILAANAKLEVFLHRGRPARRRVVSHDGCLLIEPLDREHMRSLISRTSDIVNAYGRNVAPVPAWLASEVLWGPYMTSALPVVDALTTAPIVRFDEADDGWRCEIVTEAGYHEASSVWSQFSADIRPVAERPSAVERREASELVQSLFRYADVVVGGDNPAVGRANLYGFLFSSLLRPATRWASPLPVLTSDGSFGAGNAMRAVTLGVFGDEAWQMFANDSKAHQPTSFIDGAIDGTACVFYLGDDGRIDRRIVAAVTAAQNGRRVIGSRRATSVANTTQWVAIGRTLSVVGDVRRGVLHVHANVDEGGIVGRRLPGSTREELLWAMLTLIRGWVADGCPDDPGCPRLSAFASWLHVVGGIVRSAGFADCGSVMGDVASDVDGVAL